MLDKVLVLLLLFKNKRPPNGSEYVIAELQICGWVSDECKLTAEGEMIVLEILSFIERVI